MGLVKGDKKKQKAPLYTAFVIEDELDTPNPMSYMRISQRILESRSQLGPDVDLIQLLRKHAGNSCILCLRSFHV